ncbi:MAG: hypothetical protein FWH04_04185 [Oscillospiraceae bacterium]|nr:hypothetical protein [Oscillospiraceae bacterium]
MCKRILIIASSLFMLISCTRNEPLDSLIHKKYSQMTEIMLDAAVRVDFGDRTVGFSVKYTCDPAGKGQIEVISPENIAGIVAEIGEGYELKYQDTSLELGALSGTGLSPLEFLPLMVSDWSSGYVTGSFYEKNQGQNLLVINYRSRRGETIFEHTACFTADTLVPVIGEMYIGGTRAAEVRYEQKP